MISSFFLALRDRLLGFPITIHCDGFFQSGFFQPTTVHAPVFCGPDWGRGRG